MILFLAGTAFGGTGDELVAYVRSLESSRSLRTFPDAPSFTDDELRTALGGEPIRRLVVDDGGKRRAQTIRLLHAPPGRVWASLTDRRHYQMYSEKLKHVAILDERPGTVTVFHFAEVHSMVTNRQWVLDTHANIPLHAATQGQQWEYNWCANPNSAKLIAAAQADGRLDLTAAEVEEAVTIVANEGSFILTVLPTGETLMEGYSFSDIGGSIPTWIVDAVAARELPKLLGDIDSFIAEGYDAHMTADHEVIIGPTGELVRPQAL